MSKPKWKSQRKCILKCDLNLVYYLKFFGFFKIYVLQRFKDDCNIFSEIVVF